MVMLGALSTNAQVNSDDDVFVDPIVVSGRVGPQKAAVTTPSTNGFNLAGKREGFIVSSLPATTSPSLVQSRINVMVGLAGGTVPTNRTTDPAAWHVVPNGGLKWFDVVTTTNHTWLGATTGLATNQFGHRLVVSVCGTYPVNKYWLRSVPSTAAISGAFFQVGVSSADNSEIPFNQNFVGISFGANGKLDSAINSAGIWEQRVDDVVYSNGQLPSTVVYDVWYRLGSSTVVTNPADVATLKAGDFSIMTELVSRVAGVDTTVSSQMVTTVAEKLPADLDISTSGTGLKVKIIGGSPLSTYSIQSGGTVTGPWTVIHANAMVGHEITATFGSTNQFYKAE